MILLRESSVALLLIAVKIVSVSCDGEIFDDQASLKIKRDASIGTYSYAASDISKYDGSHVKTMTVLKSYELPVGSDELSSYASYPSPRKPKVKATVEFWPPDLDKEKFYSMKKDSSLDLWQQHDKKEVKVIIKKPLPENIPDIPISIKPWSPMTIPLEIADYESLLKPTEATIIDDVAVTNPGPVVFPTNEPTTRNPERSIAFVSRGGSKKRKLKKKVKIAPITPFVETSQPDIPYTDSAIEDEKNVRVTPIYEVIDEPVINFFGPIRYTDVVNNLSNLTELSFGDKSGNNTNIMIEIIDNPNPIDGQIGDINPETASNAFDTPNTSEKSVITEPSASMTSEMGSTIDISMPTNVKDVMPLERMFAQLKRAIDERNIAKIKRIVMLLEEPKPITKTVRVTSEPITKTTATVTTTELPKTTTAAPETTEILSTAEFVSSTTARSKIYLAPRVRIAQKKLRLKNKSVDDKLKGKSAALSETFTSAVSRTRVKTTTEEMTLVSTVASSKVAPRKNRAHRSHTTLRMRKVATRSRQTAKNISRRLGRKPREELF